MNYQQKDIITNLLIDSGLVLEEMSNRQKECSKVLIDQANSIVAYCHSLFELCNEDCDIIDLIQQLLSDLMSIILNFRSGYQKGLSYGYNCMNSFYDIITDTIYQLKNA